MTSENHLGLVQTVILLVRQTSLILGQKIIDGNENLTNSDNSCQKISLSLELVEMPLVIEKLVCSALVVNDHIFFGPVETNSDQHIF